MNKKGWGLRVELLFILIFIICLVMAAIGLNRLGLLGDRALNPNDSNDPINRINDNFSYENLENQLVDGAKRYFNDYYNHTIESNELIVRASTLYYNGYTSKLYDANNNACSGYVKIINAGNGVVYSSYIKCPKYKTTGYDESNDW